MGAECDILVVGVEPVFPARQGGQYRTLGLISGLAGHCRVAFAAPGQAAAMPYVTDSYELSGRTGPPSVSSKLTAALSAMPKITQIRFGSQARDELRQLIDRMSPRAVLYAHSYLATLNPAGRSRVIVDFANIEVKRMRSFARTGSLAHRASSRLESLKASVWERKIARSAHLCLASNEADLKELRHWGARVIHVPNAMNEPSATYEPSPADGFILFLGSMDYMPNQAAARWLLHKVWPLVRREHPAAQLVIAGRASDRLLDCRGLAGVHCVGEVDSVATLLREAAVVAAPVSSGGGTQIKVVEAAFARRVMVATEFSARSVPRGFERLCVESTTVEAFAAQLAHLLGNPSERWSRESACAGNVTKVPRWADVVMPMLRAVGAI